MQSRRRHAAAAVLPVTALLVFICVQAGLVAFPLRDTRSRPLLLPPRWLPLGLRAVRAGTATPAGAGTEAVLLPGWEVIVLLRRPDATTARADENVQNATCVFRSGASSPARALGPLPASGRHAYTCTMPEPARAHRHDAPLVLFSDSTVDNAGDGASGRSSEMLKWSDRIVYESVVIDGGDVLVFAKGVNRRKKVNRAAADIRCLYYRGDAGNVVASLPATTLAQQVFRCPPPTLEAALSHGAAAHRDSCEWMVFIDVDEFLFSPHWVHSENPTKSMLHSVTTVEKDVGQVSMWCADFGPSGQTAHPKEGVTQGYMPEADDGATKVIGPA